MPSRRAFIRTIGGTGVVLGASAVGLATCDSMPASAVAAWAGPAPDLVDPRERALAWAILAPNPHNIQPWLADLREPGAVTLFIDQDRLLPMTDPHGRQITIGHGTFLELLDIAARQAGFRLEIELYPEGEHGPGAIEATPVARITFHGQPAIERDPLFAFITERRSTKTPYDPARPPSDAARASLARAVRDETMALEIVTEPVALERLKEIGRQAMEVEIATPRTHAESVRLMRIGAAAIAADPDGIDLNGPLFWWLQRLGLMTQDKAMTPGTLAYQGGLDYALGWVAGTPAMGWLTTSGNGRREQIAAGRAYLRLDLEAARQGLAIHPLSQVLQEYPEMTELRLQFQEATRTPDGHTVQMLFRLGYADRPAPAPRRPAEAIIIAAAAPDG